MKVLSEVCQETQETLPPTLSVISMRSTTDLTRLLFKKLLGTLPRCCLPLALSIGSAASPSPQASPAPPSPPKDRPASQIAADYFIALNQPLAAETPDLTLPLFAQRRRAGLVQFGFQMWKGCVFERPETATFVGTTSRQRIRVRVAFSCPSGAADTQEKVLIHQGDVYVLDEN